MDCKIFHRGVLRVKCIGFFKPVVAVNLLRVICRVSVGIRDHGRCGVAVIFTVPDRFRDFKSPVNQIDRAEVEAPVLAKFIRYANRVLG